MPVFSGTGQQFRYNKISTITNRGRPAIMVFEQTFIVKVFLQFLKRLSRLSDWRIFLILDRHPVQCSTGIAKWNCPDLTHTKFSWQACQQEVCGGEETTPL